MNSNCFESLPVEMFHYIVGFLSLKDIGSLALTGNIALREMITDWMKSASFERTMVRRLRVRNNWRLATNEFGELVKNVSVIQDSSSRLKLLSDCYKRLKNLVTRDNLGRRSQLWRQYLARTGLASALAELIKDWDVGEFHKILDWLMETEDLDGANQRVLRTYCWQFLDSPARSKWTTWLLTTFTSLRLPVTEVETNANNIRHFYMRIFGPAKIDLKETEHLSNKKVEDLTRSMGLTDFTALCDGQTDWVNLKSNVQELAEAVSSLKANLPDHLMISIVEGFFNSFITGSMNKGEIHINTTVSYFNIIAAAFLLYSSEDLAIKYLDQLSREAEMSPIRMDILAELMFALVICHVKLTRTGFGRDCTRGSVPRILTRIINSPRAPGNNNRSIYVVINLQLP